ncbi:hypothetical protein BD413DRAFT_701783 [Trametes elegans]|nr:hypothetical protein BD413DRAFT_702117 [Trametes elegans]KAI0759453.1 hypothetical protein BD413DRAFT_701783 [Trametes elegans]
MRKINENVWVFFRAWVWDMGYDRIMGYGVDFPLYQLGNTINLWVITGYGLSQVWVKTVSTVLPEKLENRQFQMVILTPNLILVAPVSTSQTSDPHIHSGPAVNTRTQGRLSEVEAFSGRTVEAAAVRLCEISIGAESKSAAANRICWNKARYFNIRLGCPGLTSSPGN